MRRIGIVLAVLLPALSLHAQAPPGWNLGGGPEYQLSIDKTEHHTGAASGSLRWDRAGRNEFGSMGQGFKADEFRGKRIRLTAYLKTKDVVEGASVWARVNTARFRVALDNMGDRLIKGSTDWRQYAIVLDVPVDSVLISFGTLLSGTGQIWADDFRLEIVGNDVPVTNPELPPLPIPTVVSPDRQLRPMNLGFEG